MEDARDLVPGVDYPRTFQEVDEWFRGDAACREYIRRLRWPGGFICPHCGWTGEPWVTSRGLLHAPTSRVVRGRAAAIQTFSLSCCSAVSRQEPPSWPKFVRPSTPSSR